jgi:hypothetical protein
VLTRVLVLAAGLALGRDRRGAVEGLAAVKELAVDRGHGGDAQGAALTASYGHAVVERGALNVEGERSCRRLPPHS